MLSINIERFLSQTLKPLLTPKIAGLFVLGLGAGLPLLMIFSSLSLWLKQAGVSKSEITFFSWAALGYGFKYIWAPLIDRVPFPVLGRMLGQRRGWMLVSQCAVMLAMIGMASIDPQYNLLWMALFAVMLGFSSATQDIVIDAYRIECADPKLQGLLAASYIAGYRLAMIISGAGLLWLVSAQQTNAEIYEYGAWKLGYLSMAAVMLLPMVAVFFIKEPAPSLENNSGDSFPNRDYMRFVLSFVVAAGVLILVFRYFGRIDFGDPSRYMTLAIEFVRLTIALIAGGLMFAWFILLNIAPKQLFSKGYVMPVKEFFSRYSLVNALLILCAIGLYRAPDIIMGTSANIFYDDLGFTLDQIATISKTFGLIMTIAGGFVGGVIMVWAGVSRTLLLGVFLAAATNLLFIWLESIGPNINGLAAVIVADNLSTGIASVAFVGWLSSLTNIKFTAMQYAIFSSLMVVGPKFVGGYSGTMIESIGYANFYGLTALLGIPIFILVWAATRR